VKSLAIELRRTLLWLGFPIALDVVNRLRELARWWPHPLRLP
jgi:hypothetical protein